MPESACGLASDQRIKKGCRYILLYLQPQTVDKVGAGIVSSTTFLHIAILLPKILKNQRILVF